MKNQRKIVKASPAETRAVQASVGDPRVALAAMGRRMTALNGLTVNESGNDGLAALFANAAANKATPMMLFRGQERTVADVMTMARQNDPDAQTALNSLRMENIDLYVRATLDFGVMYQNITLGKEEQPVIMSTFKNPVNVRFTAEDGGARGRKAVKAQQPVYINMREMHSETIGYQMRDINQGIDVAAASGATVDIGWDMAHRINIELINFLQGGTINGVNYGQSVYRPFTFTSAFGSAAAINATLVIHPSINQANLPATNYITYANMVANYPGFQTGNQFQYAVIQAVIDYCEGFRGIFPDGDIEPTGLIILPSSETTGLFKQVTPVNAFYNKVGEQILNSFTKVEYGGRVWTLMGSPILPKGACYPILNKKVANYYVKPAFDFEHVESHPLKNWEERTAVKVFALAQIEPWRVNALKIVYSNAANAGQFLNNY